MELDIIKGLKISFTKTVFFILSVVIFYFVIGNDAFIKNIFLKSKEILSINIAITDFDKEKEAIDYLKAIPVIEKIIFDKKIDNVSYYSIFFYKEVTQDAILLVKKYSLKIYNDVILWGDIHINKSEDSFLKYKNFIFFILFLFSLFFQFLWHQSMTTFYFLKNKMFKKKSFFYPDFLLIHFFCFFYMAFFLGMNKRNIFFSLSFFLLSYFLMIIKKIKGQNV